VLALGIAGGGVLLFICACDWDWFSELAIAATLDEKDGDERSDEDEEGKVEEAARRTTLGGGFDGGDDDGSGVKDDEDDEKIGGFRPISDWPFLKL
jgi:hypothetical protein